MASGSEHPASGSDHPASDLVPKSDMHIYSYVLTEGELDGIISDYGIPMDLHPRLPPIDLTMDKLPKDAIGLYEQYLTFSGVRVPFSTFLLRVLKYFKVHISQLVPIGLNRLVMFEIYCRSLEIEPTVNLFRVFYKLNKQGHWFSFANRTGQNSPGRIFKETCSSLKNWKDNFFLIDRRAIPDAMPWRHPDSSVTDDAPAGGYLEADVAKLCEGIVELRPIHSGLLYEVGLKKVWKHSGFRPEFMDIDKNGNANPFFFLFFYDFLFVQF